MTLILSSVCFISSHTNSLYIQRFHMVSLLHLKPIRQVLNGHRPNRNIISITFGVHTCSLSKEFRVITFVLLSFTIV